jgi:hypothetical protein
MEAINADRKELARHQEAIRNAVEYRGFKIFEHGDGRYMVYPPRDEAHSLDGAWTAESVDAAKLAIDQAEAL